MTKSPVQMINTDLAPLAPFFREKLIAAMSEIASVYMPVAIFEGYRSPDRQDWLWEQGRSRPGKIITGAKAWQSWHQYGLAADVVAKPKGKWTWDVDYGPIIEIMNKHGFANLKFEQCHFEITGGIPVRDARKIQKEKGLMALWRAVAAASGLLS